MKHQAVIAASVIALALAGCGKKAEPTGEASPQTDVGAVATAPASPGQAFADAAAASDSFEIESSKLAETKASAPGIKRFAGQMIKAHTESTTKLKAAAAAASPAIIPVSRLTAAQQQQLDALGGHSGAAFDRAYAQAQVAAHQATLDAVKAYAASGDVPSLKAFAGELTPVVTAHLNMAKAL